LNKLPKKVIKEGKIIDIRDDIAKVFEPKNLNEEELLSKTHLFDLNDRLKKLNDNTYIIVSKLSKEC